jgi:hypothetical protein
MLANVAHTRGLLDAFLKRSIETLHGLCRSIAAEEARDYSAFCKHEDAPSV